MAYVDYIAGSYILSQKITLCLIKSCQYTPMSIMRSNTKVILVVLDFTGDLISIMCILDWIQYYYGVSYTWKDLVLRLPR